MKASDNRFTLLSDLEKIQKFAGVDRFDLDPCADRRSPIFNVFKNWLTIEQDGLKWDWSGHVFINPPFSTVGPWIQKAIVQTENTKSITLLLPANRTDQRWWMDLWRACEPKNFHWLSPRLKFGTPDDPHGTRKKNHPPFACVAVTLWGDK